MVGSQIGLNSSGTEAFSKIPYRMPNCHLCANPAHKTWSELDKQGPLGENQQVTIKQRPKNLPWKVFFALLPTHSVAYYPVTWRN